MIVRQYAPCNLGRNTICLGKQGEINALRVEFDMSAWMAMYPDATVKLMHFAPDRPQDNPVIPTLGVEGTTRVWIVGEDDTASAGNGVIELLLIDERTGSTIKSATGYTTVLHSPSAGIEAKEAEAGYVRYDIDQSALLTDEQKAMARKNIGAGTGDSTGGITIEKDPTVPSWAKQPSKPPYTAGEVGARPDTWTPSASDVGADAAGTAAAQVGAHNVSGAAHADMRALIEGLTSRLNALADSDDTTLDQLSEIVAYIKSNKALIDAVTTGKVSTSDIVDNLTTNASGKVLSAAQGVRLKALIDAIVIPDKLPNPQPLTINGQSYDGSAKVEVTVTGEGGGVEVDNTLTQSGKAADAKVVGDKLTELNEANAQQDKRLTTLEEAGGIVTIEPADGDLPMVFFSGDTTDMSKENEKVLSISYKSKTDTFDGYVKMKWQGSSSLNFDKKNFTIKMFEDEACLTKINKTFRDWKYSKNKYVLKANYIDHTHARNIITANLWSEIVSSRPDYDTLPEALRNSPKNGAIDGFPIKLYLNGVYQGIYTWNIGKDDWMFGMDGKTETQAVLCAEKNNNGNAETTDSNILACEFRASANIDGNDWSLEVPDALYDSIKTSFNALIGCVKDTDDETFIATIEEHLDLTSALDYYILMYFSAAVDNLAKNLLMVTYDGQKWFCSAYDLDNIWGSRGTNTFVDADFPCPDSYQDTNSLFWKRIENCFGVELLARYRVLRERILTFPNVIAKFERFCNSIGTELYAEDVEIYSGIPYPSQNNLKQIRAFFEPRAEYVDACFEEIGTPTVSIPCTGIMLDQTALMFDGSGTQTLTATVTPSDTTDTVVWSSDNASIASVSGGVVTAKANGSATITAMCGAYSATCSVVVEGVSEAIASYSTDALEYHLDCRDVSADGTWADRTGNHHMNMTGFDESALASAPSGLVFSGAQSVACADMIDVSSTGTTIELCVKISDVAMSCNRIMSTNLTETIHLIGFIHANNNWNGMTGLCVDVSGSTKHCVGSPATADQMYTISLTRDTDANHKMYVDGLLVHEWAGSGNFNNRVAINIGCLNFTDFERFRGSLYSARVYSRVLTPDEVATHYSVDTELFGTES